jgi:glycosyltransferase involved in cell wall biosynthesis
VEPGDPVALAAAVREVLARRGEMGAAARTHARRFGADAYADRVEELIRP